MRARRLMTHLIVHTTLLVLSSAPAAAQPTAAPLESLHDPQARVIAHLDVSRLRAAPSYHAIEDVLAETLGDAGVADAHARDVLGRVDECVVSARVEALDAEQVLLLARGRFTLDDASRLLSMPGVSVEARGNHRLMRRGLKAAAFVGTDRFVFGHADLVLGALDRIDGRAQPAAAEHPVIARWLADPARSTQALSVVGVVEGELRPLLAAALDGSPLARASAFSVTIDLTPQLVLAISVELADAAAAAQGTAELGALLAQAAHMPLVRTMGLTGVVRALRARATDARVLLTARIRDADARRLLALLAAELGPASATSAATAAPPSGR